MKLERDTLTQAERLTKVLSHEEPDRVPCFLMGLDRAAKFWQEFSQREDELLDKYTEQEENLVITACGDYTVPVFFGADIILHGAPMEEPASQPIELQGDPAHPQVTFLEKNAAPSENTPRYLMTYFGSINKIEILNTGRPYTWYWAPYLRTPEMLVKWFDQKGWPDQIKVHSYPTEITSVNKQYGHAIHIIPSYGPSVFTHLQQMLGLDRLSYFSRKSPEVLQRIIDSFTELQLKQIAQMKPLHPIAAFTFDDLGQKDRPLLSPEMFRKFFAPARKRVNDAIHELGAKSILHSCGNATELLSELIAAGFDGWQTLEPASGIDHALVKQRFGDQLSFWGAVDNNVLCFGTPTEVKEKARHMLQIMSSRGGYVYGPAHDYLNTKVDNALALRDTLIQYGFYPSPGI